MRILSIHNNYILEGGEDVSTDTEIRVLRDNGHEVTEYREHNSRMEDLSKASVALKTVWSLESYKKVKRILGEEKYDLIHVQNFMPLISPSIYYAAKALGVPIIQAVRNYRFLCTNALLFRDGKVCELCVGKTIPIQALLHTCYKNFPTNLAVSSMLTVHNTLNSWGKVDLFACISEFVKIKMIQGGFPEEKLYVKPNFVYPDPGNELDKEKYIIYVGRLTEDKGIFSLLASMKLVDDKNTTLKIVGRGPLMKPLIRDFGSDKIQFLGKLSVEETYNLIGKASLLVIPSIWNEPFGRVVIEAYAKGTPVIGSEIGGIAELIVNEVTGFTFEAGNEFELAEKINIFYSSPELRRKMSIAARKEYEDKYTASNNYTMMMDMYNKVTNSLKGV